MNSFSKKEYDNKLNIPKLEWEDSYTSLLDLSIILPKTLFVYSDENICDERDDVHNTRKEVIFQEDNTLALKITFITYNAHNIAHNTGAHSFYHPIRFEELTTFIDSSEDEKAEKYRNMNESNWRSYFIDTKDIAASRYPTIKFGTYFYDEKRSGATIDWYVLNIENNKALLLSKYGLDKKQWHPSNRSIEWKRSHLHKWLNTSFVENAFSECEWNVMKEIDDKDKITILNRTIVEKYLKDDSAIMAKPTPFAKQLGAFHYEYSESMAKSKNYIGNGLMWLSDKSTFSPVYADAIYWNGTICSYPLDFNRAIVRPVILINLIDAYGEKTATQLNEEYQQKMNKYIKNTMETTGTKSTVDEKTSSSQMYEEIEKKKEKNILLNQQTFEKDSEESYIVLETKKIDDSLSMTKLRIGNRTVCEFVKNDELWVFLDTDNGYEPIIRYADFLEKIGFTCDSAYGITDMTYNFTYNNVNYILSYDSGEDAITFAVKSNDSNATNIFRETIAKLLSIKQ